MEMAFNGYVTFKKENGDLVTLLVESEDGFTFQLEHDGYVIGRAIVKFKEDGMVWGLFPSSWYDTKYPGDTKPIGGSRDLNSFVEALKIAIQFIVEEVKTDTVQ